MAAKSLISRVIEYLPPTLGDGVSVARDCTWTGTKYSKGMQIKMDDGNTYECTGDKDGSWKKVKAS
jgi:hypothetical protein